MTEQVGRVLGGRYRLRAPVGLGASAQVFVADDVRLRRRVAVKVLHQALSDDAEFLRRFRAEAQAVGALNHPNVMAVYDSGQDDDIPYLVTEYLGGGSLRSLLDRGRRLSPSQAVLVGVQAARGLDYAHRRGFVHRDVKPANLLFDDEGRLRIADFGLARALAEAAWTEPQGAVLGTARYASPEQAQGMPLTGRSDVYSLALVLIEAVTGEVPFATDTTLGTLMARVDRPLPVPAELGPLVGPLAAAGAPDAAARTDARALVRALSGLSGRLPRPAPLPLAGAVDLDALDDADPTLVTGARPPAEPDDDDLDVPGFVAGSGAAGREIATEPSRSGASRSHPSLARPATGGHRPPQTEDPADIGGADDHTVVVGRGRADDDDLGSIEAADEGDGPLWDPRSPTGRRRRRWPLTVAIAALLTAVAVTVGLLVVDLRGPAETHTLPRVTGEGVDTAGESLAGLGFVVRRRMVRRDGTEAGDVLASRPAAGAEVEEGATVTLVVSGGQTIVAVPDLPAGMTEAEAAARLRAAGLTGRFVPRAHEEIAAGSVVAVAGDTATRMEKGRRVTVIVSSGPAPRTIPEGLPGRSLADVVAALKGERLVARVAEDFSDDVPAGEVIATVPAGDRRVPRDSTVTVTVSKGPEPVAVPSVETATTIAEAVAILERAGLTAGQVQGPATGRPAGTTPGAGQPVRKGTEVDIILR